MTRMLKLFGLVLMACGMTLAVVHDADARRLGGGRTLGGKSALQRTTPPVKTPAQQAALKQNQQVKQQLAARGGFMGMLGALAVGGLIGALLFGGAFENLNLLDFLVLGAIAFLLFRLFAARHRSGMQADSGPSGSRAELGAQPAGQGPGGLPFASEQDRGPGVDDRQPHPAGFDEPTFLAGARRAYEVLQEGWNDGDLSEIRGLTTDRMFGELQDLYREPGADSFVKVLKVDAQLLEVREAGGTQEAAVLFDSVLRESDSERPTQVREIWHFTRPARALTPTWLLDGIEQMSD